MPRDRGRRARAAQCGGLRVGPTDAIASDRHRHMIPNPVCRQPWTQLTVTTRRLLFACSGLDGVQVPELGCRSVLGPTGLRPPQSPAGSIKGGTLDAAWAACSVVGAGLNNAQCWECIGPERRRLEPGPDGGNVLNNRRWCRPVGVIS